MSTQAVAEGTFFKMEVDGRIVIPEGVWMEPARSAAKFPDTPLAIKYYKRMRDGVCTFNIGNEIDRETGWNVGWLYVPQTVVPGETAVYFQWVDPLHACAVRRA